MRTFKEFFDQKKSLTKDEIIKHWTNLVQQPIALTPEPHDHWGTSMDEDTIRITGSQQFCDSILVRLKELLQHENPETELNLEYKELDYEHAGGLEPNYMVKIRVRYRDSAKKTAKGPVRRAQF